MFGSDGGGAAVGDEFHAVDVAGVVGGEEEGGGGDFVGAAHLAAGDEGFELALGGLVEEFFLLGGGDLAGGLGVTALCKQVCVLTLSAGRPGRNYVHRPLPIWGSMGLMTELEKGPTGRRRGRGARERILSASQQLFREQGINRTGMDQLCAAAQVSKRTAYQHFTGKDELVAEYLRRFDPSVLSGVFDRTDLTPRERLLAAFDIPPTTPLCPYIAAAVELHDPQHPASQYARDYKKAVAARLADTAREAGAADPEQLGEQLALLIDGAAARTRVLNTDAFPTAAAIAAVLIDNAIPATAGDDQRREEVSS